MMRLHSMCAKALVLAALVAPVRAERIRASIQFEVAGYPGLSKEAQATANNQATSTLQKLLAPNLNVIDLTFGPNKEGFGINVKGDWESKTPVREAAEIIRGAAVSAAAAVNVARTSVASFRVEVETVSAAAREEAATQNEREVNRERAHPQPRLDIDGIDPKSQTFQNVTILDVPLVRAMDLLGKTMPFSYVLHRDVVGLPVYVKLTDAPLEGVLAAIAESAGVKLEKREHAYVFARPEPPPAPAPERAASSSR